MQKALENRFDEKISLLRFARQDDLDKLRTERSEDIKKIMEMLTPLTDTYKTASTMGKWFMGFATFISIVVGIIVSIIALKK